MKVKSPKIAKANSYPNCCTLFALSALTDIPDEAIIKAFKVTRCYAKHRGSALFKIRQALNKLGVQYEDHFSDSPAAHQIKKNGPYLHGAKKLSEVMHKFKYLNHLVQVLVEKEEPEYHTIGVGSGHYINIELDKLDKTWYLGHFTITGLNHKWMELIK